VKKTYEWKHWLDLELEGSPRRREMTMMIACSSNHIYLELRAEPLYLLQYP
jgi:hypothetical protein